LSAVKGDCKKLSNDDTGDLNCTPDITRVIGFRMM